MIGPNIIEQCANFAKLVLSTIGNKHHMISILSMQYVYGEVAWPQFDACISRPVKVNFIIRQDLDFLSTHCLGVSIPSELPCFLHTISYNPPPTHIHSVLTNGADDASVTHHIRMASNGEQTEVFQASVGQLRLHLGNSQLHDAWISRVQPPSPAEGESCIALTSLQLNQQARSYSAYLNCGPTFSSSYSPLPDPYEVVEDTESCLAVSSLVTFTSGTGWAMLTVSLAFASKRRMELRSN